MKKRSHRLEKMARVYDAEILPIWSERFGRMMLRGLKVPPKAMVLDVGAGTGYPALEVLSTMDDSSRLIAIEAVSALLDQARKKAGELSGKRIYFRTETPSASLGFADEVYDLVLSNLGLPDLPDPQKALQEFARVTKTGGKVIVTLPLAGTFCEFYDVYREVLIKNDYADILGRLEQHIARTPEAEDAATWMENAGLENVELEIERFQLLFKSSREFFFAPVIEYGPLAAWKEIAGKGQGMQDVFWQIKESIDAYFGARAFAVTVIAGCLRGERPQVLEFKDPLPIEGDREVAEALEEVTRSGLVQVDDTGSVRPLADEQLASKGRRGPLNDLLLAEEDSEPRHGGDPERRGSGSVRRPGSDSVRRPGSDSVRRPGSDSVRSGSDSVRPGSGSVRRPGSDSARRPGSDSARRPGSDSARHPSSDSAGSGSFSGRFGSSDTSPDAMDRDDEVTRPREDSYPPEMLYPSDEDEDEDEPTGRH